MYHNINSRLNVIHFKGVLSFKKISRKLNDINKCTEFDTTLILILSKACVHTRTDYTYQRDPSQNRGLFLPLVDGKVIKYIKMSKNKFDPVLSQTRKNKNNTVMC